MKSGKIMAAVIPMLIYTMVWAQEISGKKSMEAEEVFSEIMKSLPEQMKMQIDSASTIRKSVNEKSGTCSNANVNKSTGKENHLNAVDKLPESLQEQVRKTIAEIEKSSNERRIEFKEQREQREMKRN